jgi:hypothetical protein
MRNSNLGRSSSGSFSRRRRDEWRAAQNRTVRFPRQPVNTRRGNPRRGTR